MPIMTVRKVKEQPMTMGSPEPMRPNSGNSWIRVPMPAMSNADWITRAVEAPLSPATPARMDTGARLATNMARMCCRPYGMEGISGTSASSVRRSSSRSFFKTDPFPCALASA